MRSSQRDESIGLWRSNVKCSATREMTDTKPIESDGDAALEGKCIVCGGTIFVPGAT
jgi:hypothetical protein